jgi:hypothetical protein
MKKIFQITALLCATSICAQPSIEWQRCLGGTQLDEAYCVQQTPDGGYITAGNAFSANGDVTGHHGAADCWVVKLSATGSIEWKRAYGGSSSDRAYAFENTFDGGYILAGMTESSNGNVAGYHGGKDAWVVKISTNGAIQWQKCLGGTGWDEAWDIKQTTDGGYIVAGRTNSVDGDATGTQGGLDYWIVKLTEDGVISWQRNFGGSKEDNAYAIIQTSDGGYIVAGETLSENGDVLGNHGDADFWIIKLSSAGQLEWQKPLGGSFQDRANDVVETPDGGLMVVGSVSSADGDVTGKKGGFDVWVVKLTGAGNLEWQKPFGGSSDDRGSSIRRTSGNQYIISGSTESIDGDVAGNDGLVDYWVLEITDQGEINWEISIGGFLGERANMAVPTTDNGCVVVGATWSSDGDVTGQHGPAGYSDYWVVKLSPNAVPTRTLSTAPLAITPNPAHSTISIQVPDNETVEQFTCFDALGRPVLVQHTVNVAQTIEIATLPPGMYWLQAISAAGKQHIGKFLKE